MGDFFIGVFVVIGIWVFFKMKSTGDAVNAFEASDDAESWYVENNIIPSTVLFSRYNYDGAAIHSGADVLIGQGKDNNDKTVGFAIEVVPGGGVVRGLILNPASLAGRNRAVASQAKLAGLSLISAYESMVENTKELEAD